MSTTDQGAAMLLRGAAQSIHWSLSNTPPVFESLGWADLPVMIQQTDHPSFSYKSKQTGPHHTNKTNQPPPQTSSAMAQASDVPVGAAIPPSQSSAARYKRESNMKLSRAVPQSFTTFGWGDFPVCSDSTTHHSTKMAVKHRSHAKKQLERPGTQLCFQRMTATIVTSAENMPSPCLATSSGAAASTACATFAEERPVTPQERHIRFSQVHIREHSVRLGDHPLCFSYPISLDWSYGEDNIMTIDEYEARRRPCAGISRMDVLERRTMLAESMGVTLRQMDALERERIQGIRGNVELHRTESSLLIVGSRKSVLAVECKQNA